MSISEERLAEIRDLVERAGRGDSTAIIAFDRGRIGAGEILWLLNQRERLHYDPDKFESPKQARCRDCLEFGPPDELRWYCLLPKDHQGPHAQTSRGFRGRIYELRWES